MLSVNRQAFDRVLKVQFDKNLSPVAVKAKHIEVAKRVLSHILAKEAPNPPHYNIETDGVPSNSELSVRPYGIITYNFIRLPTAGRMALVTARDLSPIRSGRYRDSWFLMADGKETLPSEIPANTQELVLTNDQPYARKIQVRGARLRAVPPGIVERVRQIVLRRFKKTVSIDIAYITLKRGYVLQRNYVQRRAGGRRRLHTKAGSELRYPALIMRPAVG